MTGAGTGTVDDATLGRFEAEARSVNHRFLKTSSRTFGPLPALDGAVEDLVRGRISRGHVSITVRWTPASGSALSRIDANAFAAAAERLAALASTHGTGRPTTADVLSVPGVLADARSGEEGERAGTHALEAATKAIQALEVSREREGAALVAEIRALLNSVAKSARTLSTLAAVVPSAAKTRLETRLRELLAGSGVEVDPQALARECALQADRSDVREEIARLEAHVEHARKLLADGGAVGRRLDFLIQELHRESNTVGSKSTDLRITAAVVDLKTHVERLREQAQNLE